MPAREACGVVGVSLQGKGATPYLYRGLRALQHRGQESAGIATSSHGALHHRRGMGLVHDIFTQDVIDALRGTVGIGHTRYSTTGGSGVENAQPIVFKLRDEDGALAHNGDIVNYERVRRRLQMQGVEFLGSADSETMAQMIALEYGRSRDLEASVRRACAELVGGYAVTMLVGSKLVAFRDPLGIRPLVLGTVDGGFAVASESVAIELMGGHLVRDVLPGEVIVIERGQTLHSSRMAGIGERAHCMFEWVYFSRPDSIAEGRMVYDVRHRIGRRLAKESPSESDLVIPVPDSSRPQALGYSEATGIPYAEGLIKNRFVERTFILPDQKRREDEVRVKLHPVPGLLEGKRIVLLDDSIVRGTTLREIVQMVRAAGAKRVDVRIGCPPIIAPCYFGVDMKERKELVANGRTETEVAEVVGADSVHYLSMAGLVEALGLPQESLCLGCLTGRYPVEVPAERRRFQKLLEEY
ncbi:MAG: amidophosphoribosyltransferase [Thermoplasmata archaeon]|nr:amidophosphoribosyltransferase [Thermoplasmata archaeon]MCI4359442.1 amidophosphoribosyltransferase [Thermoplasmata archaeon]